jgi:hypothetical protein
MQITELLAQMGGLKSMAKELGDDPIGLDFPAFDWQGTNQAELLASVDRFDRGEPAEKGG